MCCELILVWAEICSGRRGWPSRPVVSNANAVAILIGVVLQIPEETQQASLLAAGLAAVKISAPQSGLGGLLAGVRQRDDTMTLSDGESLMGDPRVDHATDHGPGGCTVGRHLQSCFSFCIQSEHLQWLARPVQHPLFEQISLLFHALHTRPALLLARS